MEKIYSGFLLFLLTSLLGASDISKQNSESNFDKDSLSCLIKSYLLDSENTLEKGFYFLISA